MQNYTNLAELSSVNPNSPYQQPYHQQSHQQPMQQQQQPMQQPMQQQQQQISPQAQAGVTKHVYAPIDRPISNNNGGLPAGQNICADCERLIV